MPHNMMQCPTLIKIEDSAERVDNATHNQHDQNRGRECSKKGLTTY